MIGIKVSARNFFGINSFIITSILVVFLVSIPFFSILRAPLIIFHIFCFYGVVFFKDQQMVIDKSHLIIATLFLYSIIQNLILGSDWIVLFQSIVVILLLFFSIQIACINSTYFYDFKRYTSLSKVLLCLLPFFCISFVGWSETRRAGLFMNPNITAHLALMLLPIVLLGLKRVKIIFLSFIVVLFIAILTASRSALMALLLSFSVFIFTSYFYKIKFLLASSILLAVTLISMYGVDLAIWLFTDVIPLFGHSDSRLLYMGYNGRDVLEAAALERFYTQPFLGLGFGGAKFEIDGEVLGTHNGLLELLLRFGLVGSFIFLLLFLRLIWMTSKQNRIFKPVTMMSLAAILSLSTNSSTFFVFNYLFIYVIFLVYLGYRVRNN